MKLLPTMLLHDAIKEFISKLSNQYKKSTLSLYSKALKDFYIWHKNDNIEEITQYQIDQFILSLDKRGFKKPTCNIYINALKTFFRFCKEQYFVNNNLTFKTYPKNDPSGRTIFKIDYDKMLINNFNTCISKEEKNSYEIILRNSLILQLLIETGITVSELSRIQIQDFNFSKNILTIPEAERPNRKIYIQKDTQDLLELFKKRLALKDENHLFFRMDKAIDANDPNKPLTTRSIERTIAGLSDGHFSPKDFRYTFMLLKLKKRKGIYKLSDIVGGISDDTKTYFRKILPNKVKIKMHDYNAYEYLRQAYGKNELTKLLETNKLKVSFKKELLSKFQSDLK